MMFPYLAQLFCRECRWTLNADMASLSEKADAYTAIYECYNIRCSLHGKRYRVTVPTVNAVEIE